MQKKTLFFLLADDKQRKILQEMHLNLIFNLLAMDDAKQKRIITFSIKNNSLPL